MYRIQLKSNQRYYPLADVGKFSPGRLIADSLGWLRLIQVSLQKTESAVATQNLDSLLFYSGRSDPKILQTRKSWILQVCCMKLENKNAVQNQNSLSDERGQQLQVQSKVLANSWFLTLSTLSGVVQGSNGFIEKI